MPAYELTSPAGQKYTVSAPEGATEADVMKYAQAQFPASNPYTMHQTDPGMDPTSSMSGTQKFLAGVGKNFVDLGRGVKQITGNMSPEQVADTRQMDRPLMDTASGLSGNIAGTVASTLPAMAVPGANTYKGAAVTNALLGALQPTTPDESRLGNMAIGGASGVAGQGVANALSRVVSPQTSKYVQLLRDEGVTPTPGQMLGGNFQRAEDKLTSVPILGDAIVSARKKGMNEFNAAAYARALDPINSTSTAEVGREGVQGVKDELSSAYNTLLPKLRLDMDPQLGKDISNLQNMVKTAMPPQRAQQFDQIMTDQFFRKLTPAGTMSGQSFKTVEEQLGKLSRTYGSSPDADQRMLGDALKESLNSMRQSLARSNPNEAAQLSKINEGYANYARIRDAASRQGSAEGVFTPAQLSAAVRAQDKSVGKGGFATGNALMQDLSDAGKNVMGSKIPDSGTPGRLLMNIGALGSGAVSPAIPLGLGAASLPYLGPGRSMAAALLADRPEMAKQIAPVVKKLGPTLAAALLANSQQQQ